MQTILKTRWLIIALWAAVVAVLVATAPNMAVLVREKGQIDIPGGYTSTLAAEMEKRHQTKAEDELSFVLVFHNPGTLTAKDKEEADRAVRLLQQDQTKLGITGITSVSGNKELEGQLLAKDNKTMLALIHVKQDGREIAGIRESLDTALKDVAVEHYFTGSKLIDEDVVISSEKGLKRTEYITVVFILLVLILVFRSVVAPVIPLLTVGITYVTSQSIVAFLVDRFHFPLSNFTQIFLVAVLFGIGTDYCILLLSRFKEELAKEPGQTGAAIIRTYATAGKTVFFSGLAALVGFASIGLATFKLYQSASAVAIGVAVLLGALFTIVPFFMYVLGPKLFWPSKASMEHHESRMWEATGRFSLRRPLMALLFVALIVAPLLISYKGTLSFNSLNELGDEYESVKGFNLISDSFGPGEAMTTKVVLENEQPMDNNEAYAAMEKVTRELLKTPGVAKVRSLTRPLGEEMKDFAVTQQAKTLESGLGQGSDGLQTIKTGLADASKSLSDSAPDLQKAASGIEELVDGTNRLKSGVDELQTGLTRVEGGIRSGAMGAGELKSGISEIRKNAALLAESSNKLVESYAGLEGGLKQLGEQYGAVALGLNQSAAALKGLDASFAALSAKYPELMKEPDFLIVKSTVDQTRSGLLQLEEGLKRLNTELSKVQAGLQQVNQGFAQAAAGQLALADGLGRVEEGAGALQNGMTAAANGQNQAIAGLPAMQDGLGRLAEGQSSLLAGFSSIGDQLKQLTDGLSRSSGGLGQIQDGLTAARSYLKDLSAAPDQETSGWFLPKEAVSNPQFQQVLNNYLSADKRLTSFEIVLSHNPYDAEALASVDGIQAAAEKAVQGTVLQNAKIGVGGVSSIYNDLQNISNADYKRTVVLMLAGIALILIVLLRSLLMPLYLIASLIICYFASLAINELVFVDIMGYSGTSWAIPFFGFVILMALGVDYSIFLMDRFNEHKDEPVEQAILTAMKNMGTVIVSAVIILAGTFAAMYPSGVMSLLQIATVVLSGLLLYALLFLQFFVPVMVRMFGKANWWPFMPKSGAAQEQENVRDSIAG